VPLSGSSFSNCRGLNDAANTQSVASHVGVSSAVAQWTIPSTSNQLSDHENKIWILHDYSLQLTSKYRDCESLLRNVFDYGTNILEPWRKDVDSVIQSILDGGQVIGDSLLTFNQRYHHHEERLGWLTQELLSARQENAILKGQIELMRILNPHHQMNFPMGNDIFNFPARIHEIQSLVSTLSQKLENEILELEHKVKDEFLMLFQKLEKLEDKISELNSRCNASHPVRQEDNQVKSDILCLFRKLDKLEKKVFEMKSGNGTSRFMEQESDHPNSHELQATHTVQLPISTPKRTLFKFIFGKNVHYFTQEEVESDVELKTLALKHTLQPKSFRSHKNFGSKQHKRFQSSRRVTNPSKGPWDQKTFLA